MNGQVEVTWRTLRTVAHAIMVHARVPAVYVHFAHKLATGTKPPVSHLRVLFFPCVVRKSAAHFETKTLNMRHQSQKAF